MPYESSLLDSHLQSLALVPAVLTSQSAWIPPQVGAAAGLHTFGEMSALALHAGAAGAAGT